MNQENKKETIDTLRLLGVEETRKLARNHCNEALDSVKDLKDSPYKDTLAHLCHTVLNRIN